MEVATASKDVKQDAAESSQQEMEKPAKRKSLWRRKLKLGSDEEPSGDESKGSGVELDGSVVGGEGGAEEVVGAKILMVRTENLEHDPFEQTQQLKVRETVGVEGEKEGGRDGRGEGEGRKVTWREEEGGHVRNVSLILGDFFQAVSAEVIKTIRDIIALNPLYK